MKQFRSRLLTSLSSSEMVLRPERVAFLPASIPSFGRHALLRYGSAECRLLACSTFGEAVASKVSIVGSWLLMGLQRDTPGHLFSNTKVQSIEVGYLNKSASALSCAMSRLHSKGRPAVVYITALLLAPKIKGFGLYHFSSSSSNRDSYSGLQFSPLLFSPERPEEIQSAHDRYNGQLY